MQMEEKSTQEALELKKEADTSQKQTVLPSLLEEITIEELAVDGICGIY